MTTADSGRYMFEASWREEQHRLEALETIWDGYTMENLERLGVQAGWRCLEVGGGNGSIAAWLCERVGPTGHVVAADLDTRFLELRALPNLEVRRLDVTQDAVEEGAFDLVHCRLLLSHLPAHEAALRRMTAALKPGGTLLVEEFDHVTFLPDPSMPGEALAVWSDWMAAFERLSAHRGLDLTYGRRLLTLLEGHGLQSVQAKGRTYLERGGVPGRDLLRLSILSLEKTLVEWGPIDAEGVQALAALLLDPSFRWQSQVMVAASGTRPASRTESAPAV